MAEEQGAVRGGGQGECEKPPGNEVQADDGHWRRFQMDRVLSEVTVGGRRPWAPQLRQGREKGSQRGPHTDQRGGGRQDGSWVSGCRRKQWSGPRTATEPVGWGLHGRDPTGGF